MTLEGVAEGLTWQKIAARFWDPDWGAEEWYVGSWMHQRVKRRDVAAGRAGWSNPLVAGPVRYR